MNNSQEDRAVNEIYQFAANLLIEERKNPIETVNALVLHGMDEGSATQVVRTLETQFRDTRNKRARQDMLIGALLCAAGTIGTVANIGLIFWGAILFGAIQLFKGLMSYDY